MRKTTHETWKRLISTAYLASWNWDPGSQQQRKVKKSWIVENQKPRNRASDPTPQPIARKRVGGSAEEYGSRWGKLEVDTARRRVQAQRKGQNLKDHYAAILEKWVTTTLRIGCQRKRTRREGERRPGLTRWRLAKWSQQGVHGENG